MTFQSALSPHLDLSLGKFRLHTSGSFLFADTRDTERLVHRVPSPEPRAG